MTTTPETTADRVVIDVDRDGWTQRLQLQIALLYPDGGGEGRRLYGPKYNGSSKRQLRCEIDARDAAEIRAYLDAVFPQEAVGRAEILAEAIEAARGEYLTDATGTGTDDAYNRGVAAAIAAIDALTEGDTAIELARQAAPAVMVNGVTAMQAYARTQGGDR